MQIGAFSTPEPEMGIPGPNQTRVTPFDKMRLFQLHVLADAYGIPYPSGCVKEEMIPVMKAAESSGVFKRGKIFDQRKFAMLQYPNNPEMWPDRPDTPKVETAPEVVRPSQRPEPTGPVELKIGDLRGMAKEQGVNSFGKSKSQLRELLGV